MVIWARPSFLLPQRQKFPFREFKMRQSRSRGRQRESEAIRRDVDIAGTASIFNSVIIESRRTLSGPNPLPNGVAVSICCRQYGSLSLSTGSLILGINAAPKAKNNRRIAAMFATRIGKFNWKRNKSCEPFFPHFFLHSPPPLERCMIFHSQTISE